MHERVVSALAPEGPATTREMHRKKRGQAHGSDPIENGAFRRSLLAHYILYDARQEEP